MNITLHNLTDIQNYPTSDLTTGTKINLANKIYTVTVDYGKYSVSRDNPSLASKFKTFNDGETSALQLTKLINQTAEKENLTIKATKSVVQTLNNTGLNLDVLIEKQLEKAAQRAEIAIANTGQLSRSCLTHTLNRLGKSMDKFIPQETERLNIEGREERKAFQKQVKAEVLNKATAIILDNQELYGVDTSKEQIAGIWSLPISMLTQTIENEVLRVLPKASVEQCVSLADAITEKWSGTMLKDVLDVMDNLSSHTDFFNKNDMMGWQDFINDLPPIRP